MSTLRSESVNQILILRLSSIGDVVLTTPVIRTLKAHFPHITIHFVVKSAFMDVLKHHPLIDHLYAYEPETEAKILGQLKNIAFDAVIDLQNNGISKRIRRSIQAEKQSILFKANLQKYLMTVLKINRPVTHIVQRYLETLIPLIGEKEVLNSFNHSKLEFHIPQDIRVIAIELLKKHFNGQQPYAFVLGASYNTKQWVNQHIIETIERLNIPVVLLGGKQDIQKAEYISAELSVPFMNAVGKFDLLTSAAIMEQCALVITPDTGLMHIAAALGLPIISIWGNTVPELGMTPLGTDFKTVQVNGLWCRPCSKLGFQRCPLGHFKCMNNLSPQQVIDCVESIKK